MEAHNFSFESLSASLMSLTEKTAALAAQWLEWDYEPTTHAEITKLVEEKNEAELVKRLSSRIDFGTAGTWPDASR